MQRSRLIGWREIDDALVGKWSQLVERTGAPPDQTLEWAEALLAARRVPVDETSVFLCEEDANLRAVVPLRIRKERRLGLEGLFVEPVNSAFSLHLSFLADVAADVCVSGIFDAVTTAHGRWSSFAFNGLVAEGELSTSIGEAARMRGYATEVEFGDASPFLAMESSWDDFLRSKSASFRANLKRKARKFFEASGGEIRFIRGRSEMLASLDAVRRIERNSWKAAEGTAITDRPWEGDFYVGLIERFAATGSVLLTLGCVGGVPAGFDLSVFGGGRGYCLKTSFDTAFSDLSVGVVLRSELMRRLFEDGLKEYDFLGKSERYKLEWTESVRRAQSIRVLSSASALGLALATRSRLKTVTRMLKPARLGRQES